MSKEIYSGSSVDNCFIINSESDADSPAKSGAMFGGITSSSTKPSKIENCYISDSVLKTTGQTAGDGMSVGTFAYCYGQNNSINSRISNCFCGSTVDIESTRSAKTFAYTRVNSGCTSPTFSNFYHSINCTSGSIVDSGLSTQKNLLKLTLSDLSNSYRLSIGAGHPVLKVFDPEITLS